jgi:hypothetical protein
LACSQLAWHLKNNAFLIGVGNEIQCIICGSLELAFADVGS